MWKSTITDETLEAVIRDCDPKKTKGAQWEPMATDSLYQLAYELLQFRKAPRTEALPHPFPPIAFVEWLQAWWKRDAAWRNTQRAMFGMDVAQLLRGVADMIESPCEGPPSPQQTITGTPIGGEGRAASEGSNPSPVAKYKHCPADQWRKCFECSGDWCRKHDGEKA